MLRRRIDSDMKTINVIRKDLNKTVFSIGFLSCVIVTTILCMTAVIHIEPSNAREFTVFEVLLKFDREFLLTDVNFSSIVVFTKALSNYFFMFAPIISALPFISIYLTERNSGYIRMTIARTGKFRYYFSKLVTAFIGGGLGIVIGVVIFGLMAAILFPSLSHFSAEDIEYGMHMYTNGMSIISNAFLSIGSPAIVVLRLISVFLFGGMSAMTAYALSSFIRNKYLVLCIPFLIVYIHDSIKGKIVISSFHSGDGEIGTLGKLLSYSTTSNLLYIFHPFDDVLYTIIFSLAALVTALILFTVFMNRRVDLGA